MTLPTWLTPRRLLRDPNRWDATCHQCGSFYAAGSLSHVEDESAQHVISSHRSAA